MGFKTKYEGPWAETKEWIQIPVADWRNKRPKTRADRCSQCGSCYLFCPSGCVVQRKKHFAADLTYCKGCGVCARECPSGAIIMLDEEKEQDG